MRVTGWTNGSPNPGTGAGYGVRINRADRHRYFSRDWPSVSLLLDGGHQVTVNVSASFWRGCPELRHKEIGRWLLARGLAPWPTGKPPTLELSPIGAQRFRLAERT